MATSRPSIDTVADVLLFIHKWLPPVFRLETSGHVYWTTSAPGALRTTAPRRSVSADPRIGNDGKIGVIGMTRCIGGVADRTTTPLVVRLNSEVVCAAGEDGRVSRVVVSIRVKCCDSRVDGNGAIASTVR